MGAYGYIWIHIWGIYLVYMGIYGSVSAGREFDLIYVLFLFFLVVAGAKRSELALISQQFLKISAHYITRKKSYSF